MFKVLVELNPKVRERRTNTIHTFKEIYGDIFSNIESKDILSSISMYVNMESSIYQICESIKNPNGKILEVEDFYPCKPGYETPIWRYGQIKDYGFNFGIPMNYLIKFTKEQKDKQVDLWYEMTPNQKQEWMDKQLWKSIVKE